jgi:hypothetical protein
VVAAAATIKTIFQLLPNGFTQKVKPFFLPENKRHCPTRLQFPPENRAEYCTSLLSAIFFNAPMLAQYRHFSPSLLRQNRQDA